MARRAQKWMNDLVVYHPQIIQLMPTCWSCLLYVLEFQPAVEHKSANSPGLVSLTCLVVVRHALHQTVHCVKHFRTCKPFHIGKTCTCHSHHVIPSSSAQQDRPFASTCNEPCRGDYIRFALRLSPSPPPTNLAGSVQAINTMHTAGVLSCTMAWKLQVAQHVLA